MRSKWNKHYVNISVQDDSDVASSQPVLDDEEKSEICVCSKAPEIIGRLTCVLWIYCNGK